jgi:hypothetical protein
MDYDSGCNSCCFINSDFSSDDYLYAVAYSMVNTEIFH